MEGYRIGMRGLVAGLFAVVVCFALTACAPGDGQPAVDDGVDRASVGFDEELTADEGSASIMVQVDGGSGAAQLSCADLKEQGLVSDRVYSYLYQSDYGEWHVLFLTDFVSLDDLFSAAGASAYWGAGASLWCDSGSPFLGVDYADAVSQCSFYGNTTAYEAQLPATAAAPAGIGFLYADVTIAEGKTAAEMLGDGLVWMEGPCFAIGLDDQSLFGTWEETSVFRFAQQMSMVMITPATDSAANPADYAGAVGGAGGAAAGEAGGAAGGAAGDEAGGAAGGAAGDETDFGYEFETLNDRIDVDAPLTN